MQKSRRLKNDGAIPVWEWIAIGVVLVVTAVSITLVGIIIILFSGFFDFLIDDTYYELSGDDARNHAEEELHTRFPPEATNFYLEYNVDNGIPLTVRFEVPMSLGTDWASEVICPQDRFPNAELIIDDPYEDIRHMPLAEQPTARSISCDKNPYQLILMQPDETATWLVTITGRWI